MDNYDGYNYETFRKLARDGSLSKYEKIGFPDQYRRDSEKGIFADIVSKVPLIREKRGLSVLDIGPGCSDLQTYIADCCAEMGHRLFFADSEEMLDLADDRAHVCKVPGLFPETADEIMQKSGGVDIVICYSVFHYVFVESNVWYFLDKVMELLHGGGQALIGDIPNVSKRKRFFASPNGALFHKRFMKTDEDPQVAFNCPEPGRIDDAVLLSMALHCQSSGCDAYVVPQGAGLPFANRRDDFLVRKP